MQAHSTLSRARTLPQGTDPSLGVLTEHLKASETPHRLIVDCTASSLIPKFYPKWMEQVQCAPLPGSGGGCAAMSSWGWEVVVHMHRSPSCSTRDPWLLCARHPLNSPRVPHLTQGIHVVTPNKKLNSGPYPAWRAVKTLQAAGAAHYMYEGTVGAGLPIISTLKTLLDTGDDILRIEGVLR